jgi:hypothetical protein
MTLQFELGQGERGDQRVRDALQQKKRSREPRFAATGDGVTLQQDRGPAVLGNSVLGFPCFRRGGKRRRLQVMTGTACDAVTGEGGRGCRITVQYYDEATLSLPPFGDTDGGECWWTVVPRFCSHGVSFDF